MPPAPPSPAAIAAQLQQAIAFHQRGQLAEAAQIYQAILSRHPLHFDALQLMGLVANQRGEFGEAARLIGQALMINPKHAPAQYNRSIALLSLGRLDEALVCCDRAIALRSGYAEALTQRGNILRAIGRPDEALAAYDRALAANGRNAEALNNRSVVLMDLKRQAEALTSVDRALDLTPGNPDTIYNRANALRGLYRLDDALAAYAQVLATRPDDHKANFNMAICRLLKGDLQQAWEQFEYRWLNPPLIGLKRDFAVPQWSGREDLSGKTILLHTEQGYGDTIQFCRYVPLVAARGARVVLDVQEPLKPLLRELDGVAAFLGDGPPLATDFHCPLLSLPRAFQTTLGTIPATIPYLRPPQEAVTAWQERLRETTHPRIGFVWRGNPMHGNDRLRSIALNNFAPVLLRDATLVSLQKDLQPDDQEWLAAHPQIHHFGNELRDFSDTAAVVSQMDMVIAVDTAVAHLAGALGKKVHILLPYMDVDWRWMVDRDDSPWYPTARLFRQRAGEAWADVVARAIGGPP